MTSFIGFKELSWLWSYGIWIYSYLCNQCLSPLMLWVWILIRARCTTLCDKVCQWLATGRWLSPGPPPIKLTTRITEILLKVTLNTIKQTNIIAFINNAVIKLLPRISCQPMLKHTTHYIWLTWIISWALNAILHKVSPSFSYLFRHPVTEWWIYFKIYNIYSQNYIDGSRKSIT